jgi:protein tyrosine phosphatase (PTP) superfamily phosphohydrolase (DUF442 family)
MVSFITPDVAIGTSLDAADARVIAEHGFRSILCLNGQFYGCEPAECGVEALKVYDFIDGPGNDLWLVRQAVLTLEKFVKQSPKVLVHCRAGRSRSVVIVAAWMMRTAKLSPEDALDFIANRREIALTPGIEDLLYSEDWEK